MRLLLDEMFPVAIAKALRDAGHDVVAAQEQSQLQGIADSLLLAEAQRRGRAIITENASDFVPLAAELVTEGRMHFGLILTASRSLSRHQKRFLGATVSALAATLEEHPSDDARSLLLWL
jgi:predicted nuclease of predicted toxin-antitoxin system